MDVIVYGPRLPLPARPPVAGRAGARAGGARHAHVLFLVMSLVGGHFHASPVAGRTRGRADRPPGRRPVPTGRGVRPESHRRADPLRGFQREKRRRGGPCPARTGGQAVGERARALVRAAAGSPPDRAGEQGGPGALRHPHDPRDRWRPAPDEALAAAARIGYPVALKVESADLPHKTEARRGPADVRDAARAARRASSASWPMPGGFAPTADVRGVLVQEMVGAGHRADRRDEPASPASGRSSPAGSAASSSRRCGTSSCCCRRWARRRRVRRWTGCAATRYCAARGAPPPADVGALVDALLRFSELCLDLRRGAGDRRQPADRAEAGRGACAVDCLIVPTGPGS